MSFNSPARAMIFVACAAVALSLSAGSAPSGVPDEARLLETLESKSPEEKLAYLLELERGTALDATIYFQTGNVYYALGQPDSSIAYYERAVEVDPEHFKAYVNMGIAYDEMGQSNPAQASYRRALEIRPDDVLAHCHLGYNLVRQGKVDEGVDHYLRALEIDPDSAQAHYNLGLAFADLKVFGEAIREWIRVTELEPDSELGQTAAENVKLIKQYLATDP